MAANSKEQSRIDAGVRAILDDAKKSITEISKRYNTVQLVVDENRTPTKAEIARLNGKNKKIRLRLPFLQLAEHADYAANASSIIDYIINIGVDLVLAAVNDTKKGSFLNTRITKNVATVLDKFMNQAAYYLDAGPKKISTLSGRFVPQVVSHELYEKMLVVRDLLCKLIPLAEDRLTSTLIRKVFLSALKTRFNATVERVRQYEAWQGLAQTSHLDLAAETEDISVKDITGRLIALQELLNNQSRSSEQNGTLESLQTQLSGDIGQLNDNEDLNGCLFTIYDDGKGEFTVVPLAGHIQAVLAGTSQTYVKSDTAGACTGAMIDGMSGVTITAATPITVASSEQSLATTTTTAEFVAANTTAAATTTTSLATDSIAATNPAASTP